jgi:hypothetical protein
VTYAHPAGEPAYSIVMSARRSDSPVTIKGALGGGSGSDVVAACLALRRIDRIRFAAAGSLYAARSAALAH